MRRRGPARDRPLVRKKSLRRSSRRCPPVADRWRVTQALLVDSSRPSCHLRHDHVDLEIIRYDQQCRILTHRPVTFRMQRDALSMTKAKRSLDGGQHGHGVTSVTTEFLQFGGVFTPEGGHPECDTEDGSAKGDPTRNPNPLVSRRESVDAQRQWVILASWSGAPCRAVSGHGHPWKPRILVLRHRLKVLRESIVRAGVSYKLDTLRLPRNVGFSADCVAKLSLRRRLSRDSVDQDVIRGSDR
jgi:hypothetical protein